MEPTHLADLALALMAEFGTNAERYETLSGQLVERHVVPPFSVLDQRQGYWQERRRAWLSLGIKSELGRGVEADASALGSNPTIQAKMATGRIGEDADRRREERAKKDAAAAAFTVPEGGLLGRYDRRGRADDPVQRKTPRSAIADPSRYHNARRIAAGLNVNTSFEEKETGTSVFDPVLCELAYRWWAPAGGLVLDPFAGGSVRGIVAGMLGHPYIGIDLSARQVEENRRQAAAIIPAGRPIPEWIVGDSRDVLPALGRLGADLVFTCPPYYNLEVYSDDPADLSRATTYAVFLELYRSIVAAACEHLSEGRFAALVVSEIRSPSGGFYGFVPDTVRALEDAGMTYYNEAILVNTIGSLPVRVGRYFEAGRKLGRTHQNVIVGVRGASPERGWSSERAAPPTPQQELWDFGDETPDAPAETEEA